MLKATHNYIFRILIAIALLLICSQDNAQSTSDSSGGIWTLGDRVLHRIDKKYAAMERSIQKQTEKMLQKVERKEQKMREALLSQTDSVAAKALLNDASQEYEKLRNKLNNPVPDKVLRPLKEYVPGLDSMQTALGFIKKSGINVNGAELQKIQEQLRQLEGKLQYANEANAFVKERINTIKEVASKKLSVFKNVNKQLNDIRKDAYYYNERVKQYKEILNDKDKLKDEVLKQVRHVPGYNSFMQRYGYLASALGIVAPESYGTVEALQGLQTRESIDALIIQRGGQPLASYVQQQQGNNNPLSEIQQQVNNVKNKIKEELQKRGISDTHEDMPDFKPNEQKTKSFWQRLEYGIDMQPQRSNYYVPSILDIGGTAGYKMNDKSIIGIGISYKLGLGKFPEKIKVSHEGVVMRSFVDYKIKGSWWISGGTEYAYLQGFRNIEQLQTDFSRWQQSGLIGISKKIGKSKTQLLWDFMSYRQTPRGQAWKLRVGLNLGGLVK